MRCLAVILLVFLVNFVCLGNKDSKNHVSKVESLSKELEESKDSISSLTKELTVLKADLEKVKTRSEAFDESVWEYGSSLVGIMLGLIVLFGVIYYIASTVAAKSTFDTNYQSHVQRLTDITNEAEFAKKRLLFDYKSFEDVYSDKDEFNKSLDNEYDTNNNTTKG